MVSLNVHGRKIHGMGDTRWTTFNKVKQCRQCIALQKRDREVIKYETAKLKRQEERLLGDLRKVAKQKQDELRNALAGNQNKMWSTLGEHRKIQMAYGKKNPEDVVESLYQMIDYKRKMKDKQIYEKRRLMQKYKELVLKKSDQEDLILMQKSGMKTLTEKKMQHACHARQNAAMKIIAANTVRETYTYILKILRKDAIYYDTVINCLESDCRQQSQMLISVTEMGQIVTEYHDDLTKECDTLERVIILNMVEREQSLQKMRESLGHIQMVFKKLVRTDSDIFNSNEYESISLETNAKISVELDEVERVLNQVLSIVLVAGYEEIYPKLYAQYKQKQRLQKICRQLTTLRESLVKGTLHIQVIMMLSAHTYNADKIKYLEEKRRFLRAIKKEKQRIEKMHITMMKNAKNFELLRRGFRHMWNILRPIYVGSDIEEISEIAEQGDDVKQFTMRRIQLRAYPLRYPITSVPLGGDSISLLGIVREKLKLLFDAFRPDSRLTRQAYLLYSRSLVVTVDDMEQEHDIDLLAGLVIEDSRLPSYASVKAASAQFVIDNTVDELALVAAQVAARRKPGAYFRKLFKEEEKRRKERKTCGIY